MKQSKKLKQPEHTQIKTETRVRMVNGERQEEKINRCIPDQTRPVVTIKDFGGTMSLVYKRSLLVEGVSTKAVNEYNRASGWIRPDDEEDEQDRKIASEKASISRTRRTIKEKSMGNAWAYFVTITLDAAKWNRYGPDGLQKMIKERAKAWRALRVGGSCPYRDYKYLFVPEPHEDGALHLHGLVTIIPAKLLIPYTMEDVQGPKALPREIVDKVKAGETIYHCSEWDDRFGWNTIEPVKDGDQAATYITKYVTKDIGADVLPTANGKRYWCSRGLKTGEVVARFSVPSGESSTKECLDLLRELASKTKRGRTLYKEYEMLMINKHHVPVPVVVTASALVNQRDRSLEAVLEELSSRYALFEGGAWNEH